MEMETDEERDKVSTFVEWYFSGSRYLIYW